MDANRKEFRRVEVQGKTYLYPFPIIKEKKYLIEVDPTIVESIISAIVNNVIESPDAFPDYMVEQGIHNDGKTIIYSLDLTKTNL